MLLIHLDLRCDCNNEIKMLEKEELRIKIELLKKELRDGENGS